MERVGLSFSCIDESESERRRRIDGCAAMQVVRVGRVSPLIGTALPLEEAILFLGC